MKESIQPPDSGSQELDLTLLKVYTFYKSVLSLSLMLMFVFSPSAPLVGGLKPTLFIYTNCTYLAINLIALFIIIPKKRTTNNNQLFASFCVDVVAIILIADTTGGITSGLGVLLVVTIAASSIIMKNQMATLIAAITSLAVIADTARMVNLDQLDTSSFLASGLMGIILFITSFLIQSLARRIRSAQQIAEQSTADLNRLQELNQLIVQRMRTGILVTDGEGRIQVNNQAASVLLGTLSENSHSDYRLVAALPTSLKQRFEQWLKAPQFQTLPFKETPASPEIQASFSPLTKDLNNDVLIFLENNQELAQRAQQMKLASLGRLTASIAHEIRNPLSAINHAAQLLEESESIDTHDRRLCEIIQNHSMRMNKIIENIVQLSQRKAPNPTRINLKQWLQGFIEEFEPQEYENTRIILNPDSEESEIAVDVSQISQVITNLVQNALRHSHLHTGEAVATLYFHIIRSTDLPVLDIIDEGTGVSEDAKVHIFEPFFTTEQGGTGLGLYISRELCEANHSRLDYVRSETGKSCFRISFAHPDRRLMPD